MNNLWLLGILLYISGCFLAENSGYQDSHFVRFNDSGSKLEKKSETLAVYQYEDSVTVISGRGKGAASSAVLSKKKAVEVQDTLKLVAQVISPKIGDEVLQATDFRIWSDKLYVSYNTKGDTFAGAIQVIDVKQAADPVLLQTVLFESADIHSLDIKNTTLYLAGATGDNGYLSPAFVEVVSLSQGLLPVPYVSKRIDLPSHAAVSVIKITDYIVAAVGSIDGGVAYIRYDGSIGEGYNDYRDLDMELYSLKDARYLDYGPNAVYCVKGTDAGLWIFDRAKKNHKTVALSGATIPQSKSTVEYDTQKLLLGLGDGGVSIFDLKKEMVIKKIAQLQTDTLPDSLTVTNAVSGAYKEFYVADGEGGVRVFVEDKNNLKMLTSIPVAPKQSVNAIRYYKKHLLMATGLGGVQIALVIRDGKLRSDEEDAYYEAREAERAADD